MAEIEFLGGLGDLGYKPLKKAEKGSWKQTKKEKPPSKAAMIKAAKKGYSSSVGVQDESVPTNKPQVVIGPTGEAELTTDPTLSAQPPPTSLFKSLKKDAVSQGAVPSPSLSGKFPQTTLSPEGTPFMPQVGQGTPEDAIAAAKSEAMMEELAPTSDGNLVPAGEIAPSLPEAASDLLVAAQEATEEVKKKTPWFLYAAGAGVLAWFFLRKR